MTKKIHSTFRNIARDQFDVEEVLIILETERLHAYQSLKLSLDRLSEKVEAKEPYYPDRDLSENWQRMIDAHNAVLFLEERQQQDQHSIYLCPYEDLIAQLAELASKNEKLKTLKQQSPWR